MTREREVSGFARVHLDRMSVDTGAVQIRLRAEHKRAGLNVEARVGAPNDAIEIESVLAGTIDVATTFRS